MPFTAQEVADAGKAGLDFFLANDPVDQVAIERPLMKALRAKQKDAPGGKQYIVEQLRMRYSSNFQWFNGSAVVTYNVRQTLEQAQYAWRSCHDGLSLSEDRLLQNGISLTDNAGPTTASDAEKMQLTNLFEEQSSVLKLGFDEQFSFALHLDGTQAVDAITGLDALVSLAPTTGVVGGLDRATVLPWRNNVATGLTTTTSTGTILNSMEITYRNCMRNGGRPDIMVAGSTFVDGYRNFILNTFGRYDSAPAFGKRVEAGTEVMTFHGTDIEWSPEFAELDARYAPATVWEKRMYMLNSKTIKLRPLQGQDRITRKPPRAYDRYEWYWAMTWRGALTMNRSNANAVLALA